LNELRSFGSMRHPPAAGRGADKSNNRRKEERGFRDMRKIVFCILLTAMQVRYSFAEWQSQNPRPTGCFLRSVFFIDSLVGWAAGQGGTILFTENGGVSWTNRNTGFEGYINDVFFRDENVGWAAGHGVILHTEDGGVTWRKQFEWIHADLQQIIFTDDSTGWVATDRGSLLRTSDGGRTWRIRPLIPPVAISQTGLAFTDRNNGWMIGYEGKILVTADGGQVWDFQESGTEEPLRSVCFTDRLNGWIVGSNGIILHTNDGGRNWRKQTPPLIRNFESVCFVDRYRGWITGEVGTILSTDDGGITWKEQKPRGRDFLYDVFWKVSFRNQTDGWIVGTRGTILHTSDGGANWSEVVQGFTASFSGVHFVNRRDGWIVGDAGVMRTTDGGMSWERPAAVPSGWRQDIFFLDRKIGWVLEGLTLFFTDDGGDTWKNLKSFSHAMLPLESIGFVNRESGWVVGDRGAIFHTDDCGSTWEDQSYPTESVLRSVVFVNDSCGWIVGSGYMNDSFVYGTILNTTDGGKTWTKQYQDDCPWLYAVQFLDSRTGWAAGESGTVLFTEDGGVNWQEKATPFRSMISDIYFLDRMTGWIAYFGGKIFFTGDGGENWEMQYFNHSPGLNEFSFVDKNTGWAVGGDGTLLKWTGNFLLADFYADSTAGEKPLTVAFTDQSEGAVTGWQWDFGDFKTSAEQNPVHVYDSTGIYTVSLTVTGTEGSNGKTRRSYVTVTETSPAADFMAEPTSGTKPLRIQLTDRSTGAITGWQWDFGDGGTSIEQNPSHTYENADTFAVSLTVEGPVGSDTEVKEKYIIALEPTGVNKHPVAASIGNRLHSNFPNPFNPVTRIAFSVSKRMKVKIAIYDVNGRMLETIHDRAVEAGYHTIVWDASHLLSGSYLIKLSSEEFQEIRKCVLLK
jgi:photosystem II stability/assembly factor-like uncharacterized protein